MISSGWIRALGALLLRAAFISAFSEAAIAQAPVPRAPDGHPDLHGTWSISGLTPLERLPGASGLVVGDAEAARLAGGYFGMLSSKEFETIIDPVVFATDLRVLNKVKGEWRTSLITSPANGRLPLTVEGRRVMGQEIGRQMADGAEGPEARNEAERCLAGSGAAPFTPIPTQMVRQIVQTPDNIMIYDEGGGDVRIVGVGASHRPEIMRTWLGDSIARWEGDILVVETAHSKPRAPGLPPALTLVREQSRVIERFSLVTPDELLYQFTIEDPAIYAAPWSAEFSMVRIPGFAHEYACHEANYSLVNILLAGRVAEWRSK